MLIFLLRHGMPEAKRADRDGPVPLTKVGHRQAKASASFLRKNKVKCVLSSPKFCCVQSAHWTGQKVHVWPCLVEFDEFGPRDYCLECLPKACAGNMEIEEDRQLPYLPDTEQLGEALRRAHFALQCVRHLREERVAIFSHADFNVLFLWCWHNFLPGKEEFQVIYPQHCGCVNVLQDDCDSQINYTKHLPVVVEDA